MRALALLVITGCFGQIEGVGDVAGPLPDGGTVQMPDGPSPEAARRLLEGWSGCMTIANFQAANMATAWGTLAGNDQRICSNCHSDGAYGYIATTDETLFFTAISQHSSQMAMYFRVDLANNKILVNVTSFQSADKKPGHPRFDAENNAGMTALRAFHASTEANTACGPSTLVD